MHAGKHPLYHPFFAGNHAAGPLKQEKTEEKHKGDGPEGMQKEIAGEDRAGEKTAGGEPTGVAQDPQGGQVEDQLQHAAAQSTGSPVQRLRQRSLPGLDQSVTQSIPAAGRLAIVPYGGLEAGADNSSAMSGQELTMVLS